MTDKVDKNILDQHWQKTRKLLTINLIILEFFALVMQFFVGALNEIYIAGLETIVSNKRNIISTQHRFLA